MSSSTTSALGQRLRAARMRADLTQMDAVVALRELGRQKLSVSTLQRWEATGSIQFEDAILLARAYGVTTDQLAGVA